MLRLAGTAITLLLAGGVATACATTREGDGHVEQVRLANDAPELAVHFPASGQDSSALAQVLLSTEGDCVTLFSGPYTRGSFHSGRGGKGNRYLLIDRDEVAHTLTWASGAFVLSLRGEVEARYEVPLDAAADSADGNGSRC